MSFWATSSGDNAAEKATTEFDAGGGFEIIPDGSTVMAAVDTVQWEQDKSFNRYINIKWKVSAPEQLAGRVTFQKLWVADADPRAATPEKAQSKRDKALRMLAAIDANAGGRLAKKGTEPTDDELTLALVNKPMVITVKVWEMGDGVGNWVAAVHPRTKELKIGETAPPKPSASNSTSGGLGADMDDDIPF